MDVHFILQYTYFDFAQSYRVSCEIVLYYNVDTCSYIRVYMYLYVCIHMNALTRLLVIAYLTRSLDDGLPLSQ